MKKTLKIILIVILALCIMVPVMATDEIASSLSTSQKEVKRGEKVTIILQLNNLPTSNTKALEGKISFDSSKLELINNENLNNWITTLSTDGTGMASYKTGSSSSDEQILKLTFKVKENAELGDTTISISNAQMALEEGNGEAGSEISVAGSSTQISIINSNNSGEDNSIGGNNVENNNANNNNNDNVSNNQKKDNTISNSQQHAKTGDLQTTALVLLITILVSASVIAYFKYKKLDI